MNYFKIVVMFFLIPGICLFPDNQNISNDELHDMSFEELLNLQVVTASYKEENLSDAPANITVISGEELRNRGYLSLMDLMEDLPGVTWVGRYSAFSSQVIRGNFNSKRLKLMINGMAFDPKNGFGTAWADRFPIDGIEKVEFIIGPYSSLYGRNTFSGVINVITYKGKDFNGINANLVYGKENQVQSTVLWADRLNEFDIYLSLFHNSSTKGINLVRDYPEYYSLQAREKGSFSGNPFEIADSASSDMLLPWNNNEIYLRVIHDMGLCLQLQYNKAELPKIGTGFTSLYYTSPEDALLEDNTFNAKVTYSDNLNENIRSETSICFQDFDWLAKNTYVNGTSRWYAQQSSSIGLNEKVFWRINSWNDIVAGLYFENVTEKQLISDNGKIPVWNDNQKVVRNYFNLTLQDEISLWDNFNLVLGLMWEHSSNYSDVLIPRFSLIYKINETNVFKGIYASGFLTPDPEVGVNQSNIPGGGLLGNLNIRPEYINSFELNYTRVWTDDLSSIISLFYNETSDIIQQVRDTTLPVLYLRTWKNIGNQHSAGADFTLNYKISRILSFFMSYSYVNGFIDDIMVGNEYEKIDRLPAQAVHHMKAGLNISMIDGKLNLYIHDLLIGESHTWVAEKIDGWQTDAPGYKLPAYNVVDVFLSTTRQLSEDFNISLAVRNVFDKKALQPAHSNYNVSSYNPIRRRWWFVRVGYNL